MTIEHFVIFMNTLSLIYQQKNAIISQKKILK